MSTSTPEEPVKEKNLVICFFVFNSLYLAAQMWCLGKFLPLLIGSLVPEEDEHWQLFQILLEITDLVFSPMITERSVGVLEGLIEEHHQTFLCLYPGRSIIPKMHYLVHYPSHMYKYGYVSFFLYLFLVIFL